MPAQSAPGGHRSRLATSARMRRSPGHRGCRAQARQPCAQHTLLSDDSSPAPALQGEGDMRQRASPTLPSSCAMHGASAPTLHMSPQASRAADRPADRQELTCVAPQLFLRLRGDVRLSLVYCRQMRAQLHQRGNQGFPLWSTSPLLAKLASHAQWSHMLQPGSYRIAETSDVRALEHGQRTSARLCSPLEH